MIQKLGKRNQPSELGRKHEKTPKTCNSRSKFPISFPYGSSMGMGTPRLRGGPSKFPWRNSQCLRCMAWKIRRGGRWHFTCNLVVALPAIVETMIGKSWNIPNSHEIPWIADRFRFQSALSNFDTLQLSPTSYFCWYFLPACRTMKRKAVEHIHTKKGGWELSCLGPLRQSAATNSFNARDWAHG